MFAVGNSLVKSRQRELMRPNQRPRKSWIGKRSEERRRKRGSMMAMTKAERLGISLIERHLFMPSTKAQFVRMTVMGRRRMGLRDRIHTNAQLSQGLLNEASKKHRILFRNIRTSQESKFFVAERNEIYATTSRLNK